MFFKNLFLIFLFVLLSSTSVFACDLDVKEKIVSLSQAEQSAAKRFFADLQKVVAKSDWSKTKTMILFDPAKEESDLSSVRDELQFLKNDQEMISQMKVWEIIGKEAEFLTPRKNFKGKFIQISLEYKGRRYSEVIAKKVRKNNLQYKKKMHFALILLFRDQDGQWKIFNYVRHDSGNLYLDFTP